MKLVYLAHPVRGDIETNLKAASAWVRWATRLPGIVPIAPYFQSVVAFSDTDESERQEGFNHGLKVLQYCQELWVCGQTISEGVQLEIDYAWRWQIPVVFHEEMT
jgi:hypothetical protein